MLDRGTCRHYELVSPFRGSLSSLGTRVNHETRRGTRERGDEIPLYGCRRAGYMKRTRDSQSGTFFCGSLDSWRPCDNAVALCYASPACFAFWCPESFLPLTIAWCFTDIWRWFKPLESWRVSTTDLCRFVMQNTILSVGLQLGMLYYCDGLIWRIIRACVKLM